jgi:hypothetical protein
MKHECRKGQTSAGLPRVAAFALRHARIVTDPRKLALLKAEAERRKRSALSAVISSTLFAR